MYTFRRENSQGPLQRLLDDIRAGKIDVIVVYKVDRLTRSLADFAKLVDENARSPRVSSRRPDQDARASALSTGSGMAEQKMLSGS